MLSLDVGCDGYFLTEIGFFGRVRIRVRIRRILVRCFYVILAICAVFSITAMQVVESYAYLTRHNWWNFQYFVAMVLETCL